MTTLFHPSLTLRLHSLLPELTLVLWSEHEWLGEGSFYMDSFFTTNSARPSLEMSIYPSLQRLDRAEGLPGLLGRLEDLLHDLSDKACQESSLPPPARDVPSRSDVSTPRPPAPPFPEPTFMAPVPVFPPPQPMPEPEIPPPPPTQSPQPRMPEPHVLSPPPPPPPPPPPESVSEPSGSSSAESYFLDRFEDLLDNLRRGQTIAPTPRPAPGTWPSVLQELDNLILDSSHVTSPEPFRGLRFVPGLRPREIIKSLLLQTRPATEPPPTQFPDLVLFVPPDLVAQEQGPNEDLECHGSLSLSPSLSLNSPRSSSDSKHRTSSHRHHLLFFRPRSLTNRRISFRSANLQEELL
ncbi:hypothetical protein EDD18DRAFT_1439251 [Armillaria luteobubalina]|uniref:Uncharacterized protein n=1 Tax=Armillaria luteobubalina TaxID=153913 RepID=A0AA39QFB3_9AGAR|nr:hypothetical protein EDD18DRAFT_1439251 [Armillaria luteobubalina]